MLKLNSWFKYIAITVSSQQCHWHHVQQILWLCIVHCRSTVCS